MKAIGHAALVVAEKGEVAAQGPRRERVAAAAEAAEEEADKAAVRASEAAGCWGPRLAALISNAASMLLREGTARISLCRSRTGSGKPQPSARALGDMLAPEC